MINFCNLCGGELSSLIPEGDNRARHVCDKCEHIQYQNPKVIVGCIPLWQDRILLCRRNIEPRFGYWTVPAGFLELDETMAEGAKRETREESLAEVEISHLHGLYDTPHIGQVYALYLAQMKSADFGATPESSEVELFIPEDIPWDDIAFKVVKVALQQFIQQGRPSDGQPFTL
jgi:ADP-ribose pyrophosphatase YjhB (NUDIX family)